MSVQPLDIVELTVESGRWPAGTVGTLLEQRDDAALVEISDDRGHMLEMLSLPVGALRHVQTPDQQALL